MDPFFALRQSGSVKSVVIKVFGMGYGRRGKRNQKWNRKTEIGIKNGMSGEVTYGHCESKCVVVKIEFKRFKLHSACPNAKKGAVSRGLDMKQNQYHRCAKSVPVKIFLL